MLTQVSITTLAAAAALLAGSTSAHTWNEQFQVIENGKFVGDYGYPRGYFDKHGEPSSNESQIVYQIPQDPKAYIDGDDFACHPYQRTQNQTKHFPRIKVTPGGYVAMKYLENGHVTQPWVNQGKPDMTGTVFVYGTTQPKSDEKLVDILQWTADGKGGDKRGALLTAQNFDDGRCHQVNEGSCIGAKRMQADNDKKMEQWCETDLKIPQTYKPGTTLSIYWIWQWSTAVAFENGKDQFYSTCSDFDVVNGPVKDTKPVHTIAQQDPQTKAVSDWASRTALDATPTVLEWDMARGKKVVATPAIKIKTPMSVIPVNVLSASACAALDKAPAASATAAGTSAPTTSAAQASTFAPASTASSFVQSLTFAAPSVSGLTASGITTIMVTSTTTVTPSASVTSATQTVFETTMTTVTKAAKAKRSAEANVPSTLPSDAKAFSYSCANSKEKAPEKPSDPLPTDAKAFKYGHAHAQAHAAGNRGSTFGKRQGGSLRVRRSADELHEQEADEHSDAYKALLAAGGLD
jgi:hypothetical protein